MNRRKGVTPGPAENAPVTNAVFIRVTWMTFVLVAVASIVLFIHPSAATAQDNPPKLPEPEYVGTVYWLDASNNKLLGLERQNLNMTGKVKGLGLGGVKSVLEASGPKSPVRFTTTQKLEFVLQASQNVDPQTIVELVRFVAQKDHRELPGMQSKGFGGMGGMEAGLGKASVPFQVAKYSESSIKISPAEALQPGEYGVRTPGALLVFCFGVDRAVGR